MRGAYASSFLMRLIVSIYSRASCCVTAPAWEMQVARDLWVNIGSTACVSKSNCSPNSPLESLSCSPIRPAVIRFPGCRRHRSMDYLSKRRGSGSGGRLVAGRVPSSPFVAPNAGHGAVSPLPQASSPRQSRALEEEKK